MMQRYMPFGWEDDIKDPNVCFIGPHVERENLSLSLMRQMCDVFVRPRGIQIGGSKTFLENMYHNSFGEVVKLALDAFNRAKGRDFKLVKITKVNLISALLYCPTFEAKEDECDKSFTFRAVVNATLEDEVLLWEIKDGKDSGEEIRDHVMSSGHYVCFEHERGECCDASGVTCGEAAYSGSTASNE